MVFDTNNLLLHIKRIMHSSIRLGYQSACDYPVVLGIGIVLLFLHKLCPCLITFLVSSSPVFLLTALLLGALLSYGEPSAPVIQEETLDSQQRSSPKPKIVPVSDCSVEEVQNVAVNHVAKSSQSPVVYIDERTSDDISHDSHCDEDNVKSMPVDAVLCTETSEFAKNEVIVEREECLKECEKVELQQFGSTNAEGCHYDVSNQYQFGELMSSCWQPVVRQDPCSDSESDLTESSSDASITDIIPMLDELNPPVYLGTDHPSSTSRDNLHSSSSDNDDNSEEDGDLSSNEDGKEDKKDDGNNLNDFIDPNSSDAEDNSNLESLMERRRAKNIMKFELDKKLMDMQAADAIQKMEEASRFRVQVPSISTPRPNPNGSDETVELPQIPDSAPSVLLPWRKSFDIPFDQIVDHHRPLQDTWTPRSYSPSTQHQKYGNFYARQSTYLRHQNGIKLEKPESSEEVVRDNHSESDCERARSNGKLFGSLEQHIGDEIKILGAAISDACVLEVNYETNGGSKEMESINGTNSFYIQKPVTSTSETTDAACAGGEQTTVCSLSKDHSSEQLLVEVDSISEVNSLFKCRMEEVLVQSISESGIWQPLAVEPESIDTPSAESVLPVIEAGSLEELNSQFAQLNGEALTCDASDSGSDNESIDERLSETVHADNGHTPELPVGDPHLTDSSLAKAMAVNVEDKPIELLTEDAEIPVLEASSIAEMNSLFRQLEQEVRAQMPPNSEHKLGDHNGETDSGVLVADAMPGEEINPDLGESSNDHDRIQISRDGEVIMDSAEL